MFFRTLIQLLHMPSKVESKNVQRFSYLVLKDQQIQILQFFYLSMFFKITLDQWSLSATSWDLNKFVFCVQNTSPRVERGTVRVKCHAKEHDIHVHVMVKPRPLNLGTSTLTISPTCLPHSCAHFKIILVYYFDVRSHSVRTWLHYFWSAVSWQW